VNGSTNVFRISSISKYTLSIPYIDGSYDNVIVGSNEGKNRCMVSLSLHLKPIDVKLNKKNIEKLTTMYPGL
jgi:hypothetical protein